MPGQAAKIVVTEKQFTILRELSRAKTSQVQIAQRATIILLAFDKQRNEDIAPIVGIHRNQVGVWRVRWQNDFEKLVSIECAEGVVALRKAILVTLGDLARSGRPPTISSEQQAKIIATACEPPESLNRPISHWTSAELAQESVLQGIVRFISSASIRRILERVDLKPHRRKYWLWSPDRRDDDFDARVATISQVYLESIELYNEFGIHTVCIDEQTGIQATERIAVDRLSVPGNTARLEFEYTRHGTVGLFGNFHVPTGEILSPLLRPTRTESDFVDNLHGVIETDPNARWRFVMDNLNTHCSESCVRYVAEACGINAKELGVKGREGHLQSMKSRQEFLTNPLHRIHFFFLPRHCSWLNQIEIWFGTLRRKVTRYGSFASVEQLCEKIEQFIAYYNTTLAHSYNWTYRGKVLCA